MLLGVQKIRFQANDRTMLKKSVGHEDKKIYKNIHLYVYIHVYGLAD